MLLSGFSAGIIHGLTNLALVEPYLDEAIGIENQDLFATGDAINSPSFWIQYDSYRTRQKSEQILAGGILGMSIGSLFWEYYGTDSSLIQSYIQNKIILVI